MNSEDTILALNAEKHDLIEEEVMEIDQTPTNKDQRPIDSKPENLRPTEQHTKDIESPKTNITTPKTSAKYTDKFKIDRSKSNIIYTDIPMPEDLLTGFPPQVVYKVMKGTLEEIVDEIKADINDIKPKLMIVNCFGKTLYNRTNQSVIDYVYELIEMVDKEKIHKIAPSTNHFIPNRPKTWIHTANFNCEMRIACIDRDQPPLTLHKFLMNREFFDHGPLLINGRMWQEYCDQTGLGETLSREGLKKYRNSIIKAFEHQFSSQHHPSTRNIGTPRPPPLAATPGYEDCPAMINILKEKGLLQYNHFYTKPSAPLRDQATPAQDQQKSRSKSMTNIPKEDHHLAQPTRPKTWYAQNIQVQAEGEHRKANLPSVGSSSSIDRETNYNEKEVSNERRKYTYKQLEREYEELKKDYDDLEMDKKEDERYYKRKTDDLYLEIEQLREDYDKLESHKEEYRKEVDNFTKQIQQLTESVHELKLADLETKSHLEDTKADLRAANRKIETKQEEIILKEERIVMLQSQYDFVKNLRNDMDDLFSDKQDKQEKHGRKKKRGH